MRVAVVVFPGSNADWDAYHTLRSAMHCDAVRVFHKDPLPSDTDAIVIPGGFSYGDYLRCGAMAAHSPMAASVKTFADNNGPVLGICNGFQILTEMGLLPGALTQNTQLTFECRDIWVRCEATGAFTDSISDGIRLKLPIAHAEGRYQCDSQTLELLKRDRRIAFRYCPAPDPSNLPYNPNGSVDDIAGIYNEKRNVLGLMPHPERASEAILGNADGRKLFENLINFKQRGACITT